ncbi:hypothetical protein IE81DRAFT_172251 [Ceraceosorus guamensis]|uniref:Uncharacterized protein n=1 Tax=Ceraceosorus guamensis TaxID=1522189 RepID=A0A316VVB3_9BASI|nr:hypothetical protein IE81DRAFT_172251 [Ceraceosorus guamensis]PWN41577.1 hypothetical protein IE81DRAFT_172251 [Ceraceosorus guamensis]
MPPWATTPSARPSSAVHLFSRAPWPGSLFHIRKCSPFHPLSPSPNANVIHSPVILACVALSTFADAAPSAHKRPACDGNASTDPRKPLTSGATTWNLGCLFELPSQASRAGVPTVASLCAPAARSVFSRQQHFLMARLASPHRSCRGCTSHSQFSTLLTQIRANGRTPAGSSMVTFGHAIALCCAAIPFYTGVADPSVGQHAQKRGVHATHPAFIGSNASPYKGSPAGKAWMMHACAVA